MSGEKTYEKRDKHNSDIKKPKAGEIELKENLVYVGRVAKVVKGGRRFSFSAIVVVGDGNGTVGHGLGKATEVTNAITKGSDDAKKNLVKVNIIGHTIPHEVIAKHSATRVLLRPAAPGTGVIAGGAMRAVLESVGVKDVLCKVLGSSNPHNVVKATIKALQMLRNVNTIAEHRGITPSKVLKG